MNFSCGQVTKEATYRHKWRYVAYGTKKIKLLSIVNQNKDDKIRYACFYRINQLIIIQ